MVPPGAWSWPTACAGSTAGGDAPSQGLRLSTDLDFWEVLGFGFADRHRPGEARRAPVRREAAGSESSGTRSTGGVASSGGAVPDRASSCRPSLLDSPAATRAASGQPRRTRPHPPRRAAGQPRCRPFSEGARRHARASGSDRDLARSTAERRRRAAVATRAPCISTQRPRPRSSRDPPHRTGRSQSVRRPARRSGLDSEAARRGTAPPRAEPACAVTTFRGSRRRRQVRETQVDPLLSGRRGQHRHPCPSRRRRPPERQLCSARSERCSSGSPPRAGADLLGDEPHEDELMRISPCHRSASDSSTSTATSSLATPAASASARGRRVRRAPRGRSRRFERLVVPKDLPLERL